MAAAPDEDARRTLAELEVKLLDLERELLAGRAAAPASAVELAGFEAAALPPVPDDQPPLIEEAPQAEGEPADADALHQARSLLAALRSTVEGLAATADRVRAEARAAGEEHARMLGRLQRVAQAAGRAEAAAADAGRLAGSVVVEVGPLADPTAVLALRDTLAAQPGARDAYVRGVQDGRAVIEVHLDPPPE
jgi:hypothetical protein